MTKVQLRYALVQDLDETLMERIAAAHGKYGIQRLAVSPDLKSVLVEYDASRLTPDEVEATLYGLGIAVNRQS